VARSETYIDETSEQELVGSMNALATMLSHGGSPDKTRQWARTVKIRAGRLERQLKKMLEEVSG